MPGEQWRGNRDDLWAGASPGPGYTALRSDHPANVRDGNSRSGRRVSDLSGSLWREASWRRCNRQGLGIVRSDERWCGNRDDLSMWDIACGPWLHRPVDEPAGTAWAGGSPDYTVALVIRRDPMSVAIHAPVVLQHVIPGGRRDEHAVTFFTQTD